MGKRLEYIDNLKGLAILMVVIGHVIQFLYSPDNFDSNIVFRVIYSFHMPLFFILSGFVTTFAMEPETNIGIKIRKRFVQLIIPFIFWGGYYSLISSRKYIHIFREPDIGLWFLLVLFDIYIFLLMTTRFCNKLGFFKNNKWSFLLQALVAYIIVYMMNGIFKGIFGLGLALQYFPYFAVGAIVRTYCNIQMVCKKKYLLIWGALFVTLVSFWYRLPSKVPSDAYVFVKYLNSFGCYRFMTALSGSIFLLVLFCNYLDRKLLLSFVGRKTLVIYILNYPIIWLVSFSPNNLFYGNILLSVLFLIVIMAVSLSVDFLVKRIPIVNTLMLGYSIDKKII